MWRERKKDYARKGDRQRIRGRAKYTVATTERD